MPNKAYALEWITFAKKNLDTAKLLFKLNHYEDIIGIELQQCLEKTLKSIMANKNIKIPRDHDLVKIYYSIEPFIPLEEKEVVLLKLATELFQRRQIPKPELFFTYQG